MGRTERLYGLTVELWLVSVLAKFSCRILLLAGFDFFTQSCLSGWFIQLGILAEGSCNNLCSSVSNIYSLLQANKSSFFTILFGLPAKGNYMMVGLIMWPIQIFKLIGYYVILALFSAYFAVSLLSLECILRPYCGYCVICCFAGSWRLCLL